MSGGENGCFVDYNDTYQDRAYDSDDIVDAHGLIDHEEVSLIVTEVNIYCSIRIDKGYGRDLCDATGI